LNFFCFFIQTSGLPLLIAEFETRFLSEIFNESVINRGRKPCKVGKRDLDYLFALGLGARIDQFRKGYEKREIKPN
jgi:hypothetical protein